MSAHILPLLASSEFVGKVYCVVTPPAVQDFTWWLDSRVRKLGLIVVGGSHLAASRKIAERLRSHFENTASTAGATG